MNTLAGQTILIVDDNPAMLDILEQHFKSLCTVILASSAARAIETFKICQRIDTVVMDINMPDMEGIAAGHAIRKLDPSVGIVYHIGDLQRYAGGARKRGKTGKSSNPDEALARLEEEVRKAISSSSDYVTGNTDEETTQSLFRAFGGRATRADFFSTVARLSVDGGAVLLVGEKGTCKDQVAKTIHRMSRNRDMPFVTLDCAAMTNAPVGGHDDHLAREDVPDYMELIGALDEADGGTIYLKTVNRMDLRCQDVLLSFFRQVGSGAEESHGSHVPDVRVVCGTDTDISYMLNKSEFNRDLYFCLSSSVVCTVPLRERSEEIPQLVEVLSDSLETAGQKSVPEFSSEAMEEMMDYNWPGNVRQLEETIRGLSDIFTGGVITGKDVYTFLAKHRPHHNHTESALQKGAKEYQRKIILDALRTQNLNINRVAEQLGVQEPDVINLIDEHSIDIVGISGQKPKVLIVDRSHMTLTALKLLLSDDYDVLAASSGQEAVRLLRDSSDIDAVIADIKLAHIDGVTLARIIRREDSTIPIIVHSGYPSSIVDQLTDEELQPYGFVHKGRNTRDLLRTIRKKAGIRMIKGVIPCTVELQQPCEPVLCHIAATDSVDRSVATLSADDESVLLLGEDGTGKSLVARAIHCRSKRRNRPLVLYRTAGKSHEQIEADLFGDKGRALNGEVRGALTHANGGTLLIKDIDRLGPGSQAKLVSSIEVGQYTMIGGTVSVNTDVRIIGTTRKDLGVLVTQRHFRTDLFRHLINGAIQLPGIEDRPDDIPSFIDTYSGKLFDSGALPRKPFTDNAIRTLSSYDWPGNLRQLMNTVKLLIATVKSNTVEAADVIDLMGPADLNLAGN